MKRRAKERKKEKDLKNSNRKSVAVSNFDGSSTTLPFVSRYLFKITTNSSADDELAVEFVEEPEVIDAIEQLASNATQLEVGTFCFALGRWRTERHILTYFFHL